MRREVLGLEMDVWRQVGSSLDSGVGHHRDHRRVCDVDETGRVEEVELSGEAIRVHDHDRPDDDHGELKEDVRESEAGQQPPVRATADVDDVQNRHRGDHGPADRDLESGIAEVGRDRLQIVGNRDRRQSDHDQVVDQDRPSGDEGDQLVERIAREGRGAAALAEHRGALQVGERGEHEEQAGDQEDHRRETESAVGDDPEREVDREANRRVDDREQPRHPNGRASAASDVPPRAPDPPLR